MSQKSIGIDLGTTNSCVAVVVDGEPRVIPNKGGYKTTPSIVAITENGRRLVGHIAKRQALTNPEHTVFAAKRLMGRRWDSDPVKSARQNIPYHIEEGPHDDVRIILRGKPYSVPEISSMILQEMRMVAEEFLGHESEQAVITVPAYFNDAQRQATKDAGEIAGLDVLRVINEPTAAALAYGFDKSFDRKIAVFDLGGGTFDISILDISNGVYEVIATAGDTYLGGEDFDARIIEWMVFDFAREHKIDLRKDRMALQRLRDAAENAKIELTGLDAAEISLPFVITGDDNNPIHLKNKLTREKLNELTCDLVQHTIEICESTLAESKLSAESLDDIILVGGMTRMPLVQESVKEAFKHEPSKTVHPDEVVAIGASIQGYALMDEESDVLLLDVTPHSLGIMIVGGFFNVLIEKNSRIPTSKSHVFTTVRDNQTSVKIMVFQGENTQAAENELLGEFILTGLRRASRGEVEIEVTFEISSDGIVSVFAKDLETSKEQSIQVTATSGLTREEIEDMIRENQAHGVQIKSSEELESVKTELNGVILDIENIMPEVKSFVAQANFGHEQVDQAVLAIERAHKAIRNSDLNAMREHIEPLRRSLQTFKGLVQRLT